MDPTNNQTPTPASTPTPMSPSSPAPLPTPGLGTPSAAPGTPVVTPSAPTVAPAAPATPVVSAAPVAPATPVNPVITPSNPIIEPGNLGVAATDPIMVPEAPKAPDPIEEELKAPMKAAAPVPGSIGSAVSGPASDTPINPTNNPFAESQNKTQSVSFNDPATQPEDSQANNPGAKKINKKMTYIALAVVGGLIIIVLAVVLIMQLTAGGKPKNTSNNGSNESSQSSTVTVDENDVQDEDEDEEDTSGDLAGVDGAVVCSMSYVDTTSGATVKASTTFNVVEDKITTIEASSETTDATGAKNTTKQIYPFADFLKSEQNTASLDQSLITADGTLKVTPTALATELETQLTSSMGTDYTVSCIAE